MKNIKQRDYLKLLPIALILLIVPLVVFFKNFKLDDIVVNYWTGAKEVPDFFSYYKMVWFISLTCISTMFFIAYLSYRKIHISFHRIYIPLAAYFFLVLLSSSFSKFKKQAFLGFPDRFEGFFTILCYIAVCLFCSILISSKFDIKYIFSFLSISVLIISVIGISQFFGFDFLQTSFGKELILPNEYHNLAKSLKFNFPDGHIYATLYNPNYVGGFFAMILPISLIIFISLKGLIAKTISGIFCVLTFINLLGSLSLTGFIGAAVALLFIVIFQRGSLKRNLIPLVSLSVCFVIFAFIMNNTSDGAIFREFGFSKVFAQTQIEDKDQGTQGVANDEAKKTNIEDLKIESNNLFLYVSNNDALVVKYDPPTSQLLFYDTADNYIDVIANSEDNKVLINFNDLRFKDLLLVISNNLVAVEAPNTAFFISITSNGLKFLSPAGQPTDIIKAESFGFKGYETWGSSRGYIWSRSLPLIKDTLLLGHGPDTYAMFFPQNDYMAKLKYLYGISTIVDKPHNIYLQIAINTGLLSLIAFLVFIAWYIIWSVRLYFFAQSNDYTTLGLACFIAVISFMISSIGNDSTISVSPVFWILLGTGIACNRLFSKANSEKLLIK